MTTRLLSSLVISSLIFFFVSLSSGAPSASNTSGVEGDLPPLQKHASFFDRNKDGIIYPLETYQGLRAIGVGIALSSASALLINSALSSKTTPGKRIDPSLPVYVKNINLGKHGSDSGAYDNEGRFVPEKFEDIFRKYAKSNANALTSNEVDEMINGNRDPNDIQGWLAARAEWKVLYMLGKDRDGLLQKDTVKAVYDGTLFWELEKQQKKCSLGV